MPDEIGTIQADKENQVHFFASLVLPFVHHAHMCK